MTRRIAAAAMNRCTLMAPRTTRLIGFASTKIAMNTPMKLRPSSLPKLALCGQFENAAGTSDAAARGTMLDAALRSAWELGEVPALSQEDAICVAYAYGAIKSLANGNHVEMNEERCRIRIDYLDVTGTADAICVDGRWHADLKSGQIYDYEAQMAAYALGLMVEHSVNEWTAYLLFCDQQRIVTHQFTFSEALAIVKAVVNNVGKTPTPNEFCGWCAKSLTCSARVAAQETALATTNDAFQAILADPDRLGDFLQRCKVFEDFQAAAVARARELLESGTPVEGWRLGKARASRYVSADTLREHAGEFTKEKLIEVCGSISANKAEQLFGKSVDHLAETKLSQNPLVSTLRGATSKRALTSNH